MSSKKGGSDQEGSGGARKNTAQTPSTTSKLQLFPNPAQQQVRLAKKGLDPVTTQIRIIDLQGRSLQVQVTEFNDTGAQLDIGALADGLYIVQVEDRSRQWRETARLVIRR